MPTGYTAGLYEGEQSFEDFVLGAARGMGALVTMRDDPSDAPIPDEFKPSPWHTEKIEAARKRLRELEAMPPEVAADEVRQEVERAKKARAERKKNLDGIRDRYEQMIEQVEAWTPPTADHNSFKKFMLDQLREALSFDCGGDLYPSIPEPLTPQGWVEKERAKAYRDIEYHSAEHEKEVERAKGRTAWVQHLRKSLNGAAPEAVSKETR